MPEQPVVMPEGVVDVGGEFYFAETRPGQGVSSVGLSDERPASGEAAGDTESPHAPRGEEAVPGQR